MLKEKIRGYFDILKGKTKEVWGSLIGDDRVRIEGLRDQFVGTLQEESGFSKDKAETRADFVSAKYHQKGL